MELAGRSAVVAGGAGGLGGATVRHLVGLGVRVTVLDPDAERAGAIVKDLGSQAAFVAVRAARMGLWPRRSRFPRRSASSRLPSVQLAW